MVQYIWDKIKYWCRQVWWSTRDTQNMRKWRRKQWWNILHLRYFIWRHQDTLFSTLRILYVYYYNIRILYVYYRSTIRCLNNSITTHLFTCLPCYAIYYVYCWHTLFTFHHKYWVKRYDRKDDMYGLDDYPLGNFHSWVNISDAMHHRGNMLIIAYSFNIQGKTKMGFNGGKM